MFWNNSGSNRVKRTTTYVQSGVGELPLNRQNTKPIRDVDVEGGLSEKHRKPDLAEFDRAQ